MNGEIFWTFFILTLVGMVGGLVWWFRKPLSRGPNTIDGTALFLAKRRKNREERQRVQAQRRHWWARPNGTGHDGTIE